jgi:SAM-dependent methyltransferase
VVKIIDSLFKQIKYRDKLAAESKKWGQHLEIEASGEWYAWLDHPLILKHYQERALIAGVPWAEYVKKQWGDPAEKSLDLGCGAGAKSLDIFQAGATKYIEGVDISAGRVAEGEKRRQTLGAPGNLRVADVNTLELPPQTYDLIFSCHSFHHFLELEHIMQQVQTALTPKGLFVLEEYVGPTQFQWTDQQMELVESLLALLPAELRYYRWGVLKELEGRPTPAEVMAVSPFESIRSAEILPLFERYFDGVALKPLGGTLQQLLYNGIVHNFKPHDEQASRYMAAIIEVEDTLIDAGLLPSDFMLLVGCPRGAYPSC